MNRILMLLAALAGALPASAADVLATPARASVRAPRATMLGIAAAGPRLVAVGERGIVLLASPGEAWSQAEVPVSVMLTAVAFADPDKGWAVGHDGVILSTNDGGRHWVRRFDGKDANRLMLADAQLAVERAARGSAAQREAADMALGDIEAAAKFGPSRPLLGLWFRDAREGFVVGAYGQAFRTEDGSVSWQSMGGVIGNVEGLHFNAVAGAPGGALAIVGESGKVWRSQDNGRSWKTCDTGYKGQLNGLLFLDGALLAYGFGGHVFRSEADGPWQEMPRAGARSLVGGARLPNGDVLLAAQDGSLLRSTDRGRTFIPLAAGGGQQAAALLVQGTNALLAGTGGVQSVGIGR